MKAIAYLNGGDCIRFETNIGKDNVFERFIHGDYISGTTYDPTDHQRYRPGEYRKKLPIVLNSAHVSAIVIQEE